MFNCRSIYSRLSELKVHIYANKPHIICLTETWMLQDSLPSFINYQPYWKMRLGAQGGGIGILVRSDLASYPSAVQFNNSKLEVQAHTVQMLNFKLDIMNIYNPAGNTNFEELNFYFQQLSNNFIIVGDFNSHHPLWSFDHSRSNTSGNAIAKILSRHDNISLNTPPKMITYLSPVTGKPSVLDLCFSSANLAPDLRVTSGPCLGSDHLPIIISLAKESKVEPILTRKRYKIKNVEWKEWKQGLPEIEWDEDASLTDLNTKLVHSIKSSSYGIPQTSGKYSPKFNKPWWDAECARLVAIRRKAKNKLKNVQSAENIHILREAERNAKIYIKEKKQKSWEEYASTIKFSTTTCEVWNKIRTLRNSYKPPERVIEDNGAIFTSSKAICKVFADHFENKLNIVYESNNSVDMFFAIQQSIMSMENQAYNVLFGHSELARCLTQLKNSSPGLDDIENIFLRKLPQNYLDYLLNLFNKSWINEEVPPDWKIGLLVPILKPDKNSMHKDSYRPISMLSCVGKLMERLVNSRLDWVLERNTLLHSCQAGFRKQHSADDQVLVLENEIRRSLSLGHCCIVVFLDLSGAFDAVDHRSVLFKLSKMGISGRILGWLQSYLADRSFRVLYRGNVSDDKPSSTGVPQGGILSPLLFNVLMSDIPILNGIKASVFADDIAFCASGIDHQRSLYKAQEQLNTIIQWTKTWGQKLNPSKTKAMIFSETTENPSNLIIEGQVVEYVDGHKFLGLTFDAPQLTWNKHINKLKIDCLKRVSIMKSITHHQWGSDRKTLIMIYKSLIRSKLDYGCQFYGCAKNEYLKELEPIQNQCLRIAAGLRTTVPINSLNVETNIPPLQFRRKNLTLRYYSRILEKDISSPSVEQFLLYQNSINKYAGFNNACEKLQREWGTIPLSCCPCLPRSPIPPWEDITHRINTEFPVDHKTLSSKNVQSDFHLILEDKFYDFTAVYTDGSKTDHHVAAAYVVPSKLKEGYMPVNKECSVLTAELLAIDRAIEWCIYNNLQKPSKYIIFTDSMSSLLLLSTDTVKTYRYLAHNILMNLSLNKEILLQWIPAHKGIAGNEQADKLAKKQKNLNYTYDKLPKEDYFRTIKYKMIEKWEQNWQSSVQYTQKGSVFTTVKSKIEEWPWASISDRKVEAGIARLRTNHVGLAQYMFRFQKSLTPLCGCGEIESVSHFLISCTVHSAQRIALRRSLDEDSINDELTVKLLLGGSKHLLSKQKQIMKHVGKFLYATKKVNIL